MAAIDPRDPAHGRCLNHGHRAATARCVRCETALCLECVTNLDGAIHCADCIPSLVEDDAPEGERAAPAARPHLDALLLVGSLLLLTALLHVAGLVVAGP